jgi:lysophospholipase-3
MRRDTENLIKSLDPPNVEYHALYGVGVKTPASFVYTDAQWPDSQPQVVYGDGDGTVNLRSLRGYQRWYGKQDQKIFSKEVSGADHLQILRHQDVLDYLVKLAVPS